MNPGRTRLIINADDLGAHPSINRGILELAEEGIVGSSSLLVTTPSWNDALEKARRVESLGIGLHLDLTMGRALSHPADVPDLVAPDGSFKMTLGQLIKAIEVGSGRRALLDQVRKEIDAQFRAAITAGASLTHFDGHQHIHMVPAIYRVACDVAFGHGIGKCRVSMERMRPYINRRHIEEFVRNMALFRFGWMAANRLRIRNLLPSPHRYYGFLTAGLVDTTMLVGWVRHAPTGLITEIGLHPGYPADREQLSIYPREEYRDWFSSVGRPIELEALRSPAFTSALRNRSIELASYDSVGRDSDSDVPSSEQRA